MAIDTTRHERIVRDYTAWVNGDSSKLDVLSESVDVYNPGLPDGAVHERSKYDAYLQDVKTGFPDLRFTEEAAVSGDDVVMVEFTIAGTHTGEFKGIPPTDREIEIRGMEKLRIADDEIREIHVYYDTREIPEQLGLTFPGIVARLPKLAWRKMQ